MKKNNITGYRLYSQQISAQKFSSAEDLIRYMLGVQAQDYASAKSALGIRLPEITDEKIEEAVAKKEIVRSWPFRGTLHFAAGVDIYWILDLLAPARISANQFRYRQLDLDKKLLSRANSVIEKILEGGEQLTRTEIGAALNDAGIKTSSSQLAHIIQNAALEKIICFGVRRGKQFTYTLLEEWIPEKRKMGRDEALAEIAKRYFISRGPALPEDFKWWTGLKISEAREAIELAKEFLLAEEINGKKYWMNREIPDSINKKRKVYLLPAFDEYLISYKDRNAILDPLYKDRSVFNNGVFYPVILIDGIVLGTWKRIINDKNVWVKTDPFISLKKSETAEMTAELNKYGEFFGKPVLF